MTGQLVTAANFQDPDGFYAAYVATHQGRADAASRLLDARLVLILANHIGDHAVLTAALRLAATTPPGSLDDEEPPAAGPEQPELPAR